ncbi:MAG: methionine biosynthesis protein MetW [Spirochaetota bacterium]|nr:methionine biosynthesis protein MetW [Spirochaetota bacterium]
MIRIRAKLVGEQILPFIHDGDNILDFGCGDMTIADFLTKSKSVYITGIDIVDYHYKRLKFIKYTKGRLPFEDNEFSVALAVFTLHHTDNPHFYLKELIRVSNNRIIIIEDTYINRFEKCVAYIVDWIGNRVVSWSINIPFNFKSMKEWKLLFDINDLTVKHIKKFYPHPIPYIPTHNVIIVLDK